MSTGKKAWELGGEGWAVRSFLEGCAGEARGCRALLPASLTSVLQGASMGRGPTRFLKGLTPFQKAEGKEKHHPHSFVPACRDPTFNPVLKRLSIGPPSANLRCWGLRRNWAEGAGGASQGLQVRAVERAQSAGGWEYGDRGRGAVQSVKIDASVRRGLAADLRTATNVWVGRRLAWVHGRLDVGMGVGSGHFG